MYLIEPCCAERHVRQLRNALERVGTREIEGYGDLSLTELLPAILTRYSETELLIAAPALPDQAAEVILRWLRKQWARMDGKGKLNVVARLTIVTDLSSEQSPVASQWLAENPAPDRLTLVSHAQPDTAILLPDFAITGPVNLRYGHHFTATATAVQEQVDALWKRFTTMRSDAAVQEAVLSDEPEEAPAAEVEVTSTAANVGQAENEPVVVPTQEYRQESAGRRFRNRRQW